MNYFITSRQDLHTSAIELAQVKRLRIFDHLNVPAIIVTMLYNFDHQAVEEKLKVKGRILNIYTSIINSFLIVMIPQLIKPLLSRY